MGRKPRNDEHDGWFHITGAGARRYDVFIDDEDRRSFLQILARNTDRTGIEIAAFCLMANHYHVVAHCPDGNLSSLMRNVGSLYTRTFNHDHGFSGSLFEDRFYSDPLDTDEYLVTTTRYVHRNPLEVGIDIKSYPWSSYADYLSDYRRSALPVSPTIPLQLAGGVARYKAFVERDLATDKASISSGRAPHKPQPRMRNQVALETVDQAIRTAGDSLGLLVGDTMTGRRRQIAILLAVDCGAYSVSEIAKHHGFTSKTSVYSAVRRARRRIESEPAERLLYHQAQRLHRDTGV